MLPRGIPTTFLEHAAGTRNITPLQFYERHGDWTIIARGRVRRAPKFRCK